MNKIKSTGLFIVMVLTLNSAKLFAQEQSQYIYPIQQKNGSYSGEGIRWILNKKDSTQFYLFGEQHGISSIPKFISHIHSKLNEDGSYILGLEMGEWITYNISNSDLNQVISKYPHSIAFDYNEEIDLIRTAKKHTEIWGVDQMFTSIHPFNRLAEIAPNENARRLAQGAFLKASLNMGSYISTPNDQDLQKLKKAFGDHLSAEAQMILENLQISMNIYSQWKLGAEDPKLRQASVARRELYMMEQFDKYLAKNKNQNVIFKMGGAHIVKGIGPNGVETLGNHISKVAEQNRTQALVIGIFNYHDGLGFISEDIFKNSDIILLDTCAFLSSKSDSIINTIAPKNKTLLNGYDAIILLNNAERSKRTVMWAYEDDFKSSLIKKITLGGILIVFCLTAVVPVLISLFSKTKRNPDAMKYHIFLRCIFLNSLFAIAIIGFQIYSIISIKHLSMILDASYSIWLYLFLFITIIYFMYKTVLFFRGQTSRKHRLYIGFITSSYALLIGFMYYWNIGGMLSF